LARHFQAWEHDYKGEHFTYDRHRVRVCWMQASPADAPQVETAWTADLDPRDNLLVPSADYDDEGTAEAEAQAGDEVPF
jgi:hypothetical protein